MHEGQPAQSLEHDGFDLTLLEPLFLFVHKLENIFLLVLKHKVELVLSPDHLFQFYDILVVQFPQRFYLAQCHALVP